MDTTQMFSSMQQQMDPRRVFGEPVERDGITVIPVAAVMSGAGGGFGDGRVGLRPSDFDVGDKPGGAEGAGGAYGLVARPVGAWVIKGGDVEWRPALNLNWVIAGGQLVGAVAVIGACLVLRRRRR